jgi:hypothetical protein
MKDILEKIKLHPYTKLWVGYCIVVCLVNGFVLAFEDDRVEHELIFLISGFIFSFALWALAFALYLAILVFSCSSGVYIGFKVKDKFHSSALGWVIGILVFCLFYVVSKIIFSEIPGLGWRYVNLLGV